MTIIVPIFCCGEHAEPVKLAEVEIPAGDTSVDLDGHRFGALCERCAAAYTWAVEQGKLTAGTPPTAAQVDDAPT